MRTYASVQRTEMDQEQLSSVNASPELRPSCPRSRKTCSCVVAVVTTLIVVGVVVASAMVRRNSRDGGGAGTTANILFCGYRSDSRALNFAVESRVYQFVSDRLVWVTQRGGGVSVWRIPEEEKTTEMTSASDPCSNAPFLKFVGGWGLAPDEYGVGRKHERGPSSIPTEGQDRHPALPDVLVLASIGPGGLYTLNASDPSNMYTLGHTPVASPDTAAGVLHVKIYIPAPKWQRVFALISVGWSSTAWPTGSHLCAVDITDARNPFQVGCIDATPVSCIEGVTIEGDVAFVGGFCSKAFVSVFLGNMTAEAANYSRAHEPDFNVTTETAGMRVLNIKHDGVYVQMVSADSSGGYQQLPHQSPANELRHESPPLSLDDVFISGLWANPGGVAVFYRSGKDVVSGGAILEVGRLVNTETTFVNRVHIHRPTKTALLPLEFNATTKEFNGGVALVDVSTLASPQLLAVARLSVASRVYCACFHPNGRVLYAFSADQKGYYVAVVERVNAP